MAHHTSSGPSPRPIAPKSTIAPHVLRRLPVPHALPPSIPAGEPARSSSGSPQARPRPFPTTSATQGAQPHATPLASHRTASEDHGPLSRLAPGSAPDHSHPQAHYPTRSNPTPPPGTSPPRLYMLKRKFDERDEYEEAKRNFGLMSRWVEPLREAAKRPEPKPEPTQSTVRPVGSQMSRPSAMVQPTILPPRTSPTAHAAPRPNGQSLPPQFTAPSQQLPPPAIVPPPSPKSKQRDEQGLCHAQETLEWIKSAEEKQKGTVVKQMAAREQILMPVDGDTVRNAIYELLNAPSRAISLPALQSVARAVNHGPPTHDKIVDDEGNPYTEYILTFIDVFLVLFRPVSTTLIPLKVGIGQSGENDETDQKAFGALTATSLASRILILIPHAHHHLLRAVWFALTFLSAAYAGSKRGVAVKFLLDRLSEEWSSREEKMVKEPGPTTEEERREAVVDAVWLKRARVIDELRQRAEKRTRSGLSLATIWAEMKGLGVAPAPTALPSRSMDSTSHSPPRSTIPRRSPPGILGHPIQPVRPSVPSRQLSHTPPRHDNPVRLPALFRSSSQRTTTIPSTFPSIRDLYLKPDPTVNFYPSNIGESTTSPTASQTTIDSTTPSPKMPVRGLGVDVAPPSKISLSDSPIPDKMEEDACPRISLSPD